MDNSIKIISASGQSDSKIHPRESSMRTDGLDDDKEQFEVNPPTKFLTSRQRHVIIGLIGLCLVVLMSFSLLMLLNILKG